jgi:hypothetical protein
MKNLNESKNRFLLSEKRPREYPIGSNDDAVCVDIASALGELDMRFILARRYQLGMQAINDAYAVVKDTMRRGTCRNPRGLFNHLLTQELKKRQKALGADDG